MMLIFFSVFACAENERSSDDAPDEHHVVPACLPACHDDDESSDFRI